MTDKELLELAARAAGIELMKNFLIADRVAKTKAGDLWAPLEDDGDALRLAVKLEIEICFPLILPQGESPVRTNAEFFEAQASDPYAATRRAIVRAAAEIGRSMR